MKRRDFLKMSAPVLALPFALRGTRMNAFTPDAWAGRLAAAATDDRILVVIQMEGGNDGLNMLVPVDDDLYYNARPTIAIAKGEALQLAGTDLLRLHPRMPGVRQLYDTGRLAVVSNIGYSNYSLSHFTGTEIWNTGSGSGASESQETGWIGRYLQGEFPQYPDQLPGDPPAIQIRPSTSSILATHNATMGVALTDPVAFDELVNLAPVVEDDAATGSLAGIEWKYIRTMETQAVAYSSTIRSAAMRARNIVEYPAGNALAESLAIVARLIAGGLTTRVYVVSIGNFDSHGNQLEHQGALLAQLSDALKAFDDDTVALGIDHRVVGMTFSEFGRRIVETASGTDHGAAAPHFVFGSAIDGGRIIGGLPDLANPDENGNLRHGISFPCYYASVLAPLFRLTEERLGQILPVGLCDAGARPRLYRDSAIGVPPPLDTRTLPVALPNPAQASTTIRFTSTVAGSARIELFDAGGRQALITPTIATHAGINEAVIDLRSLASGVYRFSIRQIGGPLSGVVVVRR